MMLKRFATCVLVTVLSHAAATVCNAADAPRMLSKGTFDSLKTEIGGLISIAIKDQSIQLNRKQWESQKEEEVANGQAQGNINVMPGNAAGGNIQLNINRPFARAQSPVDKAFTALQAAAGGMQTSAMSTNQQRMRSFAGPALAGKLITQGDSVIFELNELDGSNRTLQLTDDGAGSFRLILLHPEGDMVIINQSAKGNASVAFMIGSEKFIASDKSYLKIYQSNQDLFEKTLYPVLRHVGIGMMISPDSPQVRAAVLSMIVPPTSDDQTEAAALIKRLDDPDFATREKAREDLIARVDRFHPILREKSAEAGLSAETSESLRQIINNYDARSTESQQLAQSMKLTDDAGYLIRLLPGLKPAERPAVIAQLQKITSQTIGDDPAAWQAWQESK